MWLLLHQVSPVPLQDPSWILGHIQSGPRPGPAPLTQPAGPKHGVPLVWDVNLPCLLLDLTLTGWTTVSLSGTRQGRLVLYQLPESEPESTGSCRPQQIGSCRPWSMSFQGPRAGASISHSTRAPTSQSTSFQEPQSMIFLEPQGMGSHKPQSMSFCKAEYGLLWTTVHGLLWALEQELSRATAPTSHEP